MDPRHIIRMPTISRLHTISRRRRLSDRDRRAFVDVQLLWKDIYNCRAGCLTQGDKSSSLLPTKEMGRFRRLDRPQCFPQSGSRRPADRRGR